MAQRSFNIIAAIDEGQGLGKEGDLAWRLSADMKHFKEVTTAVKDPSLKNVLIMGRKTWESLPVKFRPLPERINIVLTHQRTYAVPNGVLVFNGLDTALNAVGAMDTGSIFVIGGANLYNQAIIHPECKGLFITQVKGQYPCDVFFPAIPDCFKLIKTSPISQENAVSFYFKEYAR